MNPILLQKQLRDNANNLQEFVSDLKMWGEEMKRKESEQTSENSKCTSHPKSKATKVGNEDDDIKKSKQNVNKRIKATDYSAWEKFDVEKECSKIDKDSDSDSELTDENDETMRDEAVFEKEKGNQFVKQQKWDEAIQCYTKAIDCYGYDPVFYANRALCYIKKENVNDKFGHLRVEKLKFLLQELIEMWKEAEADSTTSLHLDASYVKAYQRRALAREKLNQVLEAYNDIKKVLELEPHNKESKGVLERLQSALKIQETEQNNEDDESPVRPVSNFSKSRQQKQKLGMKENIAHSKSEGSVSNKIIDNAKQTSNWAIDDNIEIINAIEKPAHLRSKLPMKRITITETTKMPIKNNERELNKSTVKFGRSICTDDLKVIEKSQMQASTTPVQKTIIQHTVQNNKSRASENENPKNGFSSTNLTAPTKAVQFINDWKNLNSSDLKYRYLRNISPQALPGIFKENLESKLFSEIITILAQQFLIHNDKVYDYLNELTKVRRFSTFVMFLSRDEKKAIQELVEYCKKSEERSEEELKGLTSKYEL